ncbi:hypothetical protein D3C73_1302690 [compost metagenome]
MDTQFVIDTAEAVKKLFTDEVLSEEELQYAKDYLTGFTALPDMDDEQKNLIRNATVDNIREVTKTAFEQTVYRSYRMRYGIIINQGV